MLCVLGGTPNFWENALIAEKTTNACSLALLFLFGIILVFLCLILFFLWYDCD